MHLILIEVCISRYFFTMLVFFILEQTNLIFHFQLWIELVQIYQTDLTFPFDYRGQSFQLYFPVDSNIQSSYNVFVLQLQYVFSSVTAVSRYLSLTDIANFYCFIELHAEIFNLFRITQTAWKVQPYLVGKLQPISVMRGKNWWHCGRSFLHSLKTTLNLQILKMN